MSGEYVKARWRGSRFVGAPWYVRRVRYFDAEGRRCVAFKVRWWMAPFVSMKSSTGPYFERKRDVRRWWLYPGERPKPEAKHSVSLVPLGPLGEMDQ